MKIDWKTREKYWILPVCLVFSAIFLLFCSKSSPLYPLNDWVDANIYFTIGKGMMHGKVPYLDLYDQKGPTAFLLYGLASLVSGQSFFGVYLLETIAFSFFLFAAYRIVSLYSERFAWLSLPLLSAFVLGSMSFSHGGSFEELMMPLFAWSLYDSLRYFKNEYPAPVSMKMIARNALFAGLMLFGKFTLLAFYIAWMGVMLVYQLIRKHYTRAIISSLLFLAIMFAAGVPWIAYFAANGALNEFFHYYFYQNMFGYSYLADPVLPNMILAIVKSVGAFFYRNPQISLLILFGFVWFLTRKKDAVKTVEKINAVLLFGLLACGVYMGGQGYRYYGLVLTPFMALGIAPLLLLLDSRTTATAIKPLLTRTVFCVFSLVMLAFALFTSDNRYMLKIRREDTPQAAFAKTMRERGTEDGISLLCYAFPDAGFYLAADVIPEYRFFATSNVVLSEIGQEQSRYLAERSAEFIVTRNRDEAPEGYTLIKTQTFWSEDYDDIFRLFQRNQ